MTNSPTPPSKFKCETCEDTGYYGDNGPGQRGNNEWDHCDVCRPVPKPPAAEPTCKESLPVAEVVSTDQMIKDLRYCEDDERTRYGYHSETADRLASQQQSMEKMERIISKHAVHKRGCVYDGGTIEELECSCGLEESLEELEQNK